MNVPHDPAQAERDKGHGRLVVLVTSLDGNLTHRFVQRDTVEHVHCLAYEKLVKQQDQVPLPQTWIEHNGQRVADSVVLSTLADPRDAPGRNPDLTFSLVWTTGGGT